MKSLYSKFLLVTILTMIASSLIAFLLTNTYYHQVTKPKNDTKNVMIAKSIVKPITESTSFKLKQYLQTMGNVGYQIYLVDEDNKESFFGGEYRLKNLSHKQVDQVLNGEVYHGMRNLPQETFVTGFFANELSNTVGVPFHYQGKAYALFLRPDIKLLFSEVHTIMGGWFLFMVIISLMAMLFFAKLLIKPITELTFATGRIADERFDTPLSIERRDEIGQLAASFNTMMQRLEENNQMRREFISNVSHDFQSPLLNIQGYTGLLENKSLSPEDQQKYVEIIQSETHRLSNLTRQLLLLTSLDQTSQRAKRENYLLDQQLKRVIQKYRWLLDERQINLSMALEPVSYRGDESLLENVWENLLTNAIKYNQPSGEIEISLASSEKGTTIMIKDTGIGMDTQTIKKAFDRFYRGNESRGKDGTGLGLSIVEKIVHLHSGQIEIESKLAKGTAFTIFLPHL